MPDNSQVVNWGNLQDFAAETKNFVKESIESFGIASKDDVEKSLAKKVDKVEGKQLSTNDFTNADKQKLDDTYTKIESENLIDIKIAETAEQNSAIHTDLQEQINNIVLTSTESGDVTPEVVQARVSVDGTNHSTLKARIDNLEINNNNNYDEISELLESRNVGANITSEYDMFLSTDIQKSKFITGYSTTTYEPTIATDTSTNEADKRFVSVFKIPENIESTKIKFPTGAVAGQMLILYKSGVRAFNRTYSQLKSGFNDMGIKYVSGDDYYTLNFATIKNKGYDSVAYVGRMIDLSDMYMICDNVSFPWLVPENENQVTELQKSINDINNKISPNGKFDVFNIEDSGFLPNTYIQGLNTTNYSLLTATDGSTEKRWVYEFLSSEYIDEIRVKMPSATIANQMIILYTPGKTGGNYTYSSINSGINNSYVQYTVGDDYYVLKMYNIKNKYSNIAICGLMSDINDMYMYANGVEINWIKQNDLKANVEIVLPPRIYGVVGMETNVYFDNLLYGSRLNNVARVYVEQPAASYGDTSCYEMSDRLVWNPTTEQTDTANAKLFKHTTLIAEQTVTTTFVATAREAGSGRTRNVLVVGDSKVDNGYLTPYLYQDGVDDGNLSVVCVGTRGPANGKHEGRAGWTAKNFCENATYNNKDNAFYNGGFDFSYYMNTSKIEKPDYVFINLGTNDSASYDVDTFIGYIDTMIESIHNYDENIVICLGLAEGVCTTTTDTHYTWNDSIQLYHKGMIEKYKNSESKKIYLCPIYVSMDLANDYGMTEKPLSKRDETRETGKTRMQVTDHLHQSLVGYYKNADMMYCLIKYIENEIDKGNLTL